MKLSRFRAPRYYIILIFLCLVVLFSGLRVFARYELITYDFRLKLRPPLPAMPEIVLIEIADDTLHNLGRWPLPRDFHASLLQVLTEFGARIIVFDILFSESSLHDESFAQAIEQAGNVYLPEAFSIPEGAPATYGPLVSRAVLGPIVPQLEKKAAGIGHLNVLVDADGEIRRLPLFIQYQDRRVANVGFLAACRWLGLDPAKAEFRGDSVIVESSLRLPVCANTAFLVNYPDTWQRSFKHVSYFDILKAYYDLKNGKPPQFDLKSLKGKACFIGLTATGTSDLRAMPLDTIYPMLGLQASVFNSVVRQRFIRDVGVWLNILIAILIFSASLFISLKKDPFKAALAGLIMAGAFFTLSTALFIRLGIWTDLFFPLALILATYIGVMAYKFIGEVHQRQLLEKELDIARAIQQSFLPKDVQAFQGLSIAAYMQPAKFVAGDFYDIVVLDDHRLGVLIGDVAGKGISASLIMAQTISFFRIFSRQYARAGEVLSRLNAELFGRFPGRFVTALYMILDARMKTVSVASAAQSPLLVYKEDENRVIEAELNTNVPLGIMEGIDYPEVQRFIAHGDMLAVFSDGVFEARNDEGQEYGLQRLKGLMAQSQVSKTDASLALERIKKDLSQFSRLCPQHDDITIIVITA